VARLLIVAPDAGPPPTWDLDEDWVHLTDDPADRAHREAALRRRMALAGACRPRPRVAVDDDDLAHRAGRWVALSPTEAAVVRALAAREGRAVPRAELATAAWAAEVRDDRAVDGVVRRARAKLAVLGVAIHGVSGVGYLLHVGPPPAA
jgi:DNA-binding response OmpR family regulator